MIDIECLKGEIVESLRPLEPEKIILFGSYAYGEPTEESDVDLLILKKLEIAEMQDYVLQARKKIRPLIFREKISFDIFVESPERLEKRIREIGDLFYIEIKEKGKVIYG